MVAKKSLAGCNAVIFAATGAIAGAAALEFAKLGARIYISGRNRDRLLAQAQYIGEQTGEDADVSLVDATSPTQIERYYRMLHDRGVRLTWVFNGIGVDPLLGQYGWRTADVDSKTFLEPFKRIVGSQFLTSTLAVPHLRRQGQGRLVLLTSGLSTTALPGMAGITAASDGVQGLARVLCAEYAPDGIQVQCLRLAGVPDTPTIALTNRAIALGRGASVDALAVAPTDQSQPGSSWNLARAAAALVHAITSKKILPQGQPQDILPQP